MGEEGGSIEMTTGRVVWDDHRHMVALSFG